MTQIGSQILNYQSAFQHAIATNQEVALHTWSHNLLTTRDNLGVVAELGWNMQIIYDLSGRVPQLYRPPQGDLDARVRAIAKELFNLTAVMWNDECNDWCIQENGQSACPGRQPGNDAASVRAAIQQTLNKPKSPGVSLLEHELNSQTVGFFKDYYPQLSQMGWKAQAVSDHYGQDWYANAKGNFDAPANVSSMLIGSDSSAVVRVSSSSSSSAPTSTVPSVSLTSGSTPTASSGSKTTGAAQQQTTPTSTSGSSRAASSALLLTIATLMTALYTTM